MSSIEVGFPADMSAIIMVFSVGAAFQFMLVMSRTPRGNAEALMKVKPELTAK